MKKLLAPLCVVVTLEILSYLSAYFVTQNAVNSWYRGIAKSTLNPPDWLFAPVWAVLYALLGVALYRLWQHRRDPRARRALAFFLIQLVCNYAWSFVFFGFAAFTAAFILLLVIVAFTAMAMQAAHKIDGVVVRLMAPYLAWVSFATWLTFAVMRLN